MKNQIDILYSDRLNGIISEDDYVRYSKNIKAKQDLLDNQKKEISKYLNSNKLKKNKDSQEMYKIIQDFFKMENPDKKILYQLIDKIEIDENKNVYITFAFKELEGFNQMMLYNK